MQEAYRPPRSHSKSLLFQWGLNRHINFFPILNMYQAKSGVKNFSLYLGGGGGRGEEGVPQQKFFSQVWTCIKPNLVSKIFPFTETGYTPWDLRPGTPPDLRPGIPPDLRPGTPPPLTWTWDPPDLRPGTPLPGPGTPPPGPGTSPTWTWTWDPPPKRVWQTENITSRHPSDAGGNNYINVEKFGYADYLHTTNSFLSQGFTRLFTRCQQDPV